MMAWLQATFASTSLQIVSRRGTSPLPFFVRGTAFDLWALTVCSDCFSLFPAAQIQAGTLVARSTSLRQTNSTSVAHRIVELASRSYVTTYDTFGQAVGRL